MTKRAAIYARVSTDEQAEKGYSLPSQIEACQRYAEAHNFEVVGIYQDDISGATPIYTRPEGLRLQTFLEERGAEVVIVYQVDRLYRDHIELLITTRQWLRAGVELHFCDIGKVKSENDILLLIRGWAGSDERDKIKERMGRGKEAKVKSGRVMSAAVTPYGYDFRDGQITPNADAQTVKMIFDWYTYGDGEGPLTLREITKRLDAMGIQAPGVNVYKRKRPATQWGADTIGRLLSCETYVGEWMWGKTRWVNGKRDRHPESEPIKVNVPALVSREQFALAQERKEYNKRVAQRNRKRDYLLVGHVRCHCGRAMVGSWSHISNWGYYTCTNARQKVRDVDGKQICNARYVRCNVLDAVAWEYITNITTNHEYFKQKLQEAQQNELDALYPKVERLTHVNGLLERCDKEAFELGQALRKAKGRVEEVLEVQMDEVNARYASLCQEARNLETEIAAGALSDAQITALQTTFEDDFFKGLKRATFEDKRRTFELLKLQIVITEDYMARVSCRLRIPESVIALDQSTATSG